MTRGKLWGGLFVLFFAGVITGIVGTCLYHRYEREHRGSHGPQERQERIMKRLTHELALTPAQQAELGPIVRRTHTEIMQLRFRHQPEAEQILTRGITEMKAKLSPEQQTQLDAVHARLLKRWQMSKTYLDSAGSPRQSDLAAPSSEK